MSYSLVFKKGGVEILSLGTGHPLSAAFLDKPHDEFEPMPRTAFADAMHALIRKDESYEDDAEMYTKMLEHSNDWEEKWELVSRLNDIKKYRKSLAEAKIMLNMLEMIWTEGSYTNEDILGLEWAVL